MRLKREHEPLFAQDPPHTPVLLFLFVTNLRGKALRSRREHARPAACLKIYETFTRPFRLEDHSTVPAGINEESVDVGDGNADSARTGVGLSFGWGRGPDSKRGAVYPTNDVVQRAVRTVGNARCVSMDPTRVGTTRTFPFELGLATIAGCSQSRAPMVLRQCRR